jgi:alpha-amylase/alpha-mannosidase (GH57 family)
MRSVVLHAHFYQPPREDPRTDRVPRELSAHPFHDWNERVLAECYRPITEARILDGDGGIRRMVNTLDWLSWDAGPTLLRWMAREAPETYRAFIEADIRSVRRLGHGNAVAAPFHHVILPLASRRDKVTEVRWGIRDFRRRFGRDPEGMWLPETAVDLETLGVLADEGIRFTILAPHQVEGAPADGGPGIVALPGGGKMVVFPYDGGLSHGVAFGQLLKDAESWERAIRNPGDESRRALVTMATDGETFGHHHRWGDLALAAVVERLAEAPDLRIENPASYLAAHPSLPPLELVENTSWSCAHGVERWRGSCGCRMDVNEPPAQEWREPLREGLVELAHGLHRIFQAEGRSWTLDPWEARDRYGDVVDAGPEARARFAQALLPPDSPDADVGRVLDLLEMERDALRMFTSCGWFFDDIGGLEPLQVLRYAAHAIDAAGEISTDLEAALLRHLGGATSTDPEVGDGGRVWIEAVRGAPGAEEVADRLGEGDSGVPSADQSALWADMENRLPPERESLAPLARDLGFSEEALGARSLRASGPLRFVFGIHVHQPVGNFDAVFADHADSVYEPLLRTLEEADTLPVALHVSGPLLDWLDRHGHGYLDRVARLAGEGRIELLLSGFYEPVLPALDRPDRLDQIRWMREWMRHRMGVEATGLWLTERVWEPDLAGDLADAGVRYVFLDDWHLGASGLETRDLHRPFRTDWAGKGVDVLPIDERLRYLVPFRPPEELADYLLDLKAAGRRMAVLADDGEKFGGWPGTAEWVWGSGWMDRFLRTLTRLRESGDLELVTPSQALDQIPSAGPIYLPSGSYREMEEWSRPRIGEVGRGGHWRNFLTRYPESNRMHKKAQRLSRLCRDRGDPPEARRAIGMAQCNDAYWHGVFGGLYLRHLRGAIWGHLADAERALREGEGVEVEALDLDGDGSEELWIHGGRFSAVVAPRRGGGIEELSLFARRRNLADVLTRRREAYHLPDKSEIDPTAQPADALPDPRGAEEGGMPSIHDRERTLAFRELPPADLDLRAILVDRVLPGAMTEDEYREGRCAPVLSWARRALSWTVTELDAEPAGERAEIHLSCDSPGSLSKRLAFGADGSVAVSYEWDPTEYPRDALFAPEISASEDLDVVWDLAPAEVWRFEIRTVSKTEAGSEETVQGISTTPRWPVALGQARFTIRSGS